MKPTSRISPSLSLIVIGVAAVATLSVAAWSPSRASSDQVSGEAVYREYCASCHDHPGPRVPPRSALQVLSAARILRTLDGGVMMRIAYGLQRNQREAVAKYLGTATDDTAPPAAAFCADRKISLSADSQSSWFGWSPSETNTRFQPPHRASLAADTVRNLKLKWAFGFAGDITAYAAPTIQDGVLFVGSAGGLVHAMNAKTGCLYWTFQADGPVRAATVIAPNGRGHSILFPDQIGSFYSLDAETGRLLWKRRIDPHEATRLTGSAAYNGGVVFVPAASWEETRSGNPKYPCCTFRGSLSALRISDGSIVWKTYMIDPPKKTGQNKEGTPQFGPSGAGIWSAPTIDTHRGVVYVTTGDNYTEPTTKTSDAVVALNLKSGKIVWIQQVLAGDFHSGGACPDDDSKCGPDYDFGASAILRQQDGNDRIIAGQKSGIVYGLDPDARGKILWQTRVGKGGLTGGVQWGMASDGEKVYAAVSDVQGLPDKEGGGESAPIGGGNFDPVAGGGLTALRVADGGKAWFAPSYPCAPPRRGCSPAQSGAVTAIAGAVFSGSLDGHIRAFSTADGHLLWDFDTEKDFATVNGITAHGGSLDGAGPVIVDGMVYVNSGYPRFGGQIGNVLLAFSADDKKAD